ncbi:hypothetical protein [uncultured Erythrobacter sp.]|nr:hypothetical protein [uncultured Erythrobacter sp.]
MRHHLIALFALLSGIAALQAPAQASVPQSMVQDARITVRAHDSVTAQESAAAVQSSQRTSQGSVRVSADFELRLSDTTTASVVIGSDRALE